MSMKVVSRGLVSVVGKISVVLMGCAMVGCTKPGAEGGAKSPEGGGESSALDGKSAPEVVGEFVTGDGPKTVAEAKGTVTIVDFWGTFCEPCKKSFPKLQEMVDTQAGKLAVIAVSQDDPEEAKAEDIKKFAEELHVSFPIVWDKDKKTAGAYNPPKMPTSYILDKKGNVRFVHGGYTDGEEEKIAKEVEALIAE
jgi:cytochrome c biogenesis protein CcmG/thiol:disulfide interchange protein DsbE